MELGTAHNPPGQQFAQQTANPLIEVASLGPVEECQDLVGGEFPHGERRSVVTGFSRQGPVVDSQIDLAAVVAIAHLDTDERREVAPSGMIERCTIESSLQRVAQRAQRLLLPWNREVVEVTGLAINETSHQQTAGSGESEPAGLGEPVDDLCDAFLEGRQQGSETPR